MAIGVTDGDVRADGVVLLVHRYDARRREAVNGRQDRRRHERAVRQRQEVETVVDQIELVGPLEERRDVETFGDLRLDVVVLLPTARDHRRETSTGLRVARREEGDVDTACYETFGQQRHELLHGL
jgi:hypothetical protein